MKILKLFLLSIIVMCSVSFAHEKIDPNQMLFLPSAVIPNNPLGFKSPPWKKMVVKGLLSNTPANYTIFKNSKDVPAVKPNQPEQDYIAVTTLKNVLHVTGKINSTNVNYKVSMDSKETYHVAGDLGPNCKGADYSIYSIEQGIKVRGKTCDIEYSLVNRGDGTLKLFSSTAGIFYRVRKNGNRYDISNSSELRHDEFSVELIP